MPVITRLVCGSWDSDFDSLSGRKFSNLSARSSITLLSVSGDCVGRGTGVDNTGDGKVGVGNGEAIGAECVDEP